MHEHEKDMYFVCIVLIGLSITGIFLFQSPNDFPTITGYATIETSEETDLVRVNTEHVTSKQAIEALLQAEADVKEMDSFNLSTFFVKDTLLQAKRAFIGHDVRVLSDQINKTIDNLQRTYLQSLFPVAEETPTYEVALLDYSEVLRLIQLITTKKEQAYNLLDTLTLVEEQEKIYDAEGADTSQAMLLLEKAQTSFAEERYDESQNYLEETGVLLETAHLEHKRTKGLVRLGKNFFVRNWWQILLVVAILAVIARPTSKKIRITLAQRKLETLQLELKTLMKLLKNAQEDCFRYQKITQKTYKIKAELYKKRIAEIKHTIPVLQSIIMGEKKKGEKKPTKRKGILEVKR